MLRSRIKSTTLNTRREEELLLCCARTRLDDACAARISTFLREDIDWGYLLQIADRHGLTPLLFRTLRNSCADSVPSGVLADLQADFRLNTVRNLYLLDELLSVLGLLEANQIPVVSLKGPLLALSLYDNVDLRQCADLDIFVSSNDVARAEGLLKERQYTCEHIGAFFPEYHFQSGATTIDLHWHIMPLYFSLNWRIEHLLQNSITASFADQKVRYLKEEDTLLILCMYAAKELWELRLVYVTDISELIQKRQELDWAYIEERAGLLGIQRILLLGLRLASELLGAALPTEVAKAAYRDKAVHAMAARVRSGMFSPPTDPSQSLLVRQMLVHPRARERLRDKVASYFSSAQVLVGPNERDRAFVRLPSYLSFAYYLLRPIRVMAEAGAVVGSRTRPAEQGDGPNRGYDLQHMETLPIDNNATIEHRDDVVEYDVEGDIVLYNPEEGLALTLNGSAREIWQLCHSHYTIAKISEEIAGRYGCSRIDLQSDVESLIGRLAQLGFVHSLR